MNSTAIRTKFLDYFGQRGHRPTPSSSLVPHDDPTLLFTNAGMVQFKRIFTGEEKRDYVRAVTSQKCVRAGGKHNDLENVGYTARHHTFFEMLGNFSFGDYFKEQAVEYAWELLTEGYGLPKDRLYATVYQDDDEAFELWRRIAGLPAERVIRLGEKDNFWAMGDVGPCGPCSEILIDQGSELGCGRPDCAPGCDCDRFLEIWNLVFMQFERHADGRTTPLPKPSIDTGMGLERLSAVLAGVVSNFETDLFKPLLERVSALSGRPYRYGVTLTPGDEGFQANVSLRVVADHARAVTFLIGDGVRPENLGRGYVLRRILRRAVRHGRKLGLEKPFMGQMARAVIEGLGQAYPDLVDNADYIAKTVSAEEERFSETLGSGLSILNESIEDLLKKDEKVVPGEVVFKLYDTFGFPVDLVADVARERSLTVDEAGFEAAMARQKAKGRAAWKSGTLKDDQTLAEVDKLTAQGFKTVFVGYDELRLEGQTPSLMTRGSTAAETAAAGDEIVLVFARTPFYAASGGQEGDAGTIFFPAGRAAVVEVVKAPGSGVFLHRAQVTEGVVGLQEPAVLWPDPDRRRATANNHTATHLLHRALRETLGSHVRQAGSLVAADRLRFDFTHDQAATVEELENVERLVNLEIQADHPVNTEVMGMDEAVRSGAMALFEERYGEEVRVVTMGPSRELCGGTHAPSTGRLGAFHVVSESAVSAGVRRLECLTGPAALAEHQSLRRSLHELGAALKAKPEELLERVKKLQARVKELDKGPVKSVGRDAAELLDKAATKNGVTLLAAQVQAADPKSLRELGDALRDRLGPSAVLALGAASPEGKALLLVTVGPKLLDRFQAGRLVSAMAEAVGGRGGGKPELAQAGGPVVSGLPTALARIESLVLGG